MSGVVAIVGRPNVGKSTLFNRLIGERKSIVNDRPHVTRDRIYGMGEINGEEVHFIDTEVLNLDLNIRYSIKFAYRRRWHLLKLTYCYLLLTGKWNHCHRWTNSCHTTKNATSSDENVHCIGQQMWPPSTWARCRRVLIMGFLTFCV